MSRMNVKSRTSGSYSIRLSHQIRPSCVTCSIAVSRPMIGRSIHRMIAILRKNEMILMIVSCRSSQRSRIGLSRWKRAMSPKNVSYQSFESYPTARNFASHPS